MRISLVLLFCWLTVGYSAELIVIRHGQGTHNINREYNSNPSHPRYKPAYLTPLGHKQVQMSAQQLQQMGIGPHNIEKVYVSPLPRTQQTAEWLIAEGVIRPDQIIFEPRLIEVQEGEREGLQYAENIDHWDRSQALEFGGETDEELRARLADLLEEVKKSDKHIIFVTHGSPAKQIDYMLANSCRRLNTAEFHRYTLASASK